MIPKIIIDADLCIKLGASDKYRFLYELLPLLADVIYMHKVAYEEVLAPNSAVDQLKTLVCSGKVSLVSEEDLDDEERSIFDATFQKLGDVMLNPACPRKNKGEVSSLAYAKVTGIPVFATDEMDLQKIIDEQLNTGIDDIHCIRIKDIILMAKNGKIPVARKKAKAIWRMSGKKNEDFDVDIWPLNGI